MINYLPYQQLAVGFPTAVQQDPDTGQLGLKPPSQFLSDTINFIWPVIMVYVTSIVGWKAMRELFNSLKGN